MHSDTRKFRTCCGLASLFVSATAVSQESIGSLEWFQTQWGADIRFEIPHDIYIEYSVERRVAGTKEDLQRLAGQVEGKPDHPLRARYEALLWQETHGSKITRYRLWYENEDRWRLGNDFFHDIPIDYIDTSVSGSSSWQMSDRQLRLMNSRRPPEGRDPFERIRTLPFYLREWKADVFRSTTFGERPVAASVTVTCG